jgi:hypothetical protein
MADVCATTTCESWLVRTNALASRREPAVVGSLNLCRAELAEFWAAALGAACVCRESA